jgi:GH18 family chitinase
MSAFQAFFPLFLGVVRKSRVVVLAFFLTGCATQIAYIPVVGPGFRLPRHFRMVGYFPSWSGDPKTLEYRALTDICWAFASPEQSATYATLSNSRVLKTLVELAHRHHVRVLVSLDGGDSADPKAFPTIVAYPALTDAFVNNTLGLVARYHLDGVDIDWEFPPLSQAQEFATFVHELAVKLHAEGKLLSLAVSTSPDVDRAYLDSVLTDVDFVNIMAYDDGWGEPLGWPQSSYHLARNALDYWLNTRHLPPAKAILGVPFYGRSFKNHHARTYRAILERDARASASDASNGYSYNGFDTLRAKAVNLARVHGGGIMIWQLNQDARGANSLLNAIFDAVKEPVDQ